MKKFSLLLSLMTASLFFVSFKTSNNFKLTKGECDVAQFYEAFEPERDTKVLTSAGELENPELMLIPTKFDEGTYDFKLTRKGNNIYKLEGTKFYIQTRSCFEYVTYKDVLLKVNSNFGFSKGTIYFD